MTRSLLILSILLFCSFPSFSQNNGSRNAQNVGSTTNATNIQTFNPASFEATNLDFAKLRQQANQFYQFRNTGRGSGYKQWKRWEWFMQDRLNADGEVFNYTAATQESYERYQATMMNRPEADDPVNATWEPIGPTAYINGPSGYNPGVGRVNVIFVDPNNANTVYAGTPAGGLWRSTNGGTSWTALTDNLTRIGVSGIAIDPANSNHIYILTGDSDGGNTPSIGVYESTNGGSTWTATGLTFGVTSNVRGREMHAPLQQLYPDCRDNRWHLSHDRCRGQLDPGGNR
ncbi:MAG: hypothetical protein R3B47_13870 [Bacteroidia bacterium]